MVNSSHRGRAIGDLASFIRNTTYIAKDGGLRDEILACQHEKRNAYDPFAVMRLLQLAITSLASLFAQLIC